MVKEYQEKATEGRFIMRSADRQFAGKGLRNPDPASVITIAYNKGAEQQVLIDEVAYRMPEHSILPLVSNQHFVFEQPEALTVWQFNREFYCIIDHDAEVGCVGFLFYGIQHPIFVALNEDEVEELAHLEKVCANEMEIRDNFQGEMLRTLLKRIIIKTTRMAKMQHEGYRVFPDERMDLIRRFSLLLEEHFKEEHQVRFYAEALNKSPKTLSNVFALLKQPTPSALIRERLILEAKRYLQYTDKSAKEIAYELGFESPAHFSRFFKTYAGTNISTFRDGEEV